MTFLEHAQELARKGDLLHAEAIERTLPDGAMWILAKEAAHHANVILNSLPCCAMPLPSLRDQACSEAMDLVLGQGRR